MPAITGIANYILVRLGTSTNDKALDGRSISFFNYLISGKTMIPFKFYSLFELSRVEITNAQIVNNSNNIKMMMIIVYIVIKLLIGEFLLQNSAIKTLNGKKNVKIVIKVFTKDQQNRKKQKIISVPKVVLRLTTIRTKLTEQEFLN